MGYSDVELELDPESGNFDSAWNTIQQPQGVVLSKLSTAMQPLSRRQVKAARGHFKKGSFKVKPEIYLSLVREL